MGKPIIGLLLILSSFFFLAAQSQQYSCPDYDCRPYPQPPRRIYYKIIFFVFISSRGECQSVYEVARASNASCSPTNFGTFFITDSPMRASPNIDSAVLGRMQGTAAAVGRQSRAYLSNLAFVFNPQYYNGSTLLVTDRSVGGTDAVNEIPIIGGSGLFRNPEGRGYSTVYSLNGATGERITRFEFSFYVTQE